MWIVDAHRDGKRFIVRADEKLTGFLELERVTANHYAFQMPNDIKRAGFPPENRART
jgi:hypothetical protein